MKTQTATLRKVIEWHYEQPLITRKEAMLWLYGNNQLAENLPYVKTDLDTVKILTAATLQRPVRSVAVVNGCGRFLQVNYKPVDEVDPDLIVALVNDSQSFVRAMREFQDIRFGVRFDWYDWYERMMQQCRNLIAPLQRIGASETEFKFVLKWASLIAASGN